MFAPLATVAEKEAGPPAGLLSRALRACACACACAPACLRLRVCACAPSYLTG
mgnify:CR=1 FL=1